MPRLSIIIPALGNSARLESTLVSVLENRPLDCDIIVVHTGEYNDPYDLAGEIHVARPAIPRVRRVPDERTPEPLVEIDAW